jgi:hypothetical protein
MIKAEALRASFLNRLNWRFVGSEAIREKLERGFAPELLVPREINLAHSANADEGIDPVMTNDFSRPMRRLRR